MELIIQGAEAKLFRDGEVVIKQRIKKNYRLAEIDTRLRKSRTKREEKVYRTLNGINFPCPRLINSDEKETLKIEFIDGPVLRDILSDKNFNELSEEIGRKIARLHNQGIIHGDLTTSNMILRNEIYFIDFGLSFFSQKIEDKATDLHLLKEALESTHPLVWEKSFETVLKEYKEFAKEGKEIIDRLQKVEERGRNKAKI